MQQEPAEEAEASIPTENVRDGPNLNRTFTVRRKPMKRTYPWDPLGTQPEDDFGSGESSLPYSPHSPHQKQDGSAKKAKLQTTDRLDTDMELINMEKALIGRRVRCPVCEQWVECNDSTSVSFDKEFKTVGKSTDPHNINIAKLGKAFLVHVADFHATEPVWNAVPKMDLASSSDAVSLVSSRSKSKLATRAGLVNYGLCFAGRHMPALPIDLAEDWAAMRYVMIAKVSYAIGIVADASTYLRGRTSVLNAPDKATGRSWLKGEAAAYLVSLIAAIVNASPSERWKLSTRARRINAHHIFFLVRDDHRSCPALLVYKPGELPSFDVERATSSETKSAARSSAEPF
jgi:hypothetical protein